VKKENVSFALYIAFCDAFLEVLLIGFKTAINHIKNASASYF